MKFKVRCKEDISEVFEVYDVCRFRAQNKQGYDIRFLIYDGTKRINKQAEKLTLKS
jgi:hypothetical protein